MGAVGMLRSKRAEAAAVAERRFSILSRGQMIDALDANTRTIELLGATLSTYRGIIAKQRETIARLSQELSEGRPGAEAVAVREAKATALVKAAGTGSLFLSDMGKTPH